MPKFELVSHDPELQKLTQLIDTPTRVHYFCANYLYDTLIIGTKTGDLTIQSGEAYGASIFFLDKIIADGEPLTGEEMYELVKEYL